MDTEQLRLRAGSLCQFLAERGFSLSHNQCLDLLAAAAGLRNWPEVIAFPEKVGGAKLDQQAGARLGRRIASKGGPEIPGDELLSLLQATPPSHLRGTDVWPGGPPSGIYVTLDVHAVTLAIERYSEGSGDAMFFTSGVDFFEGNAIELGETGIFSAGLARAPTGTLLVMDLAIGRARWEDLKSRMTAAWNAADGGMRVLVLCSTPTPESLYRDVSLLTHTEGEPAPGETNWLVGIVSDDGHLRVQTPFAPARPGARRVESLPASELTLPQPIAEHLSGALSATTTGIVVAGMYRELNETNPLEVIAAMLPQLLPLGPIGRIPRHNVYDGHHQVPDAIALLPVFSSVESAIEAGCATIVFDMAFYDELEEIRTHVQRSLFVIGVKALSVGRGITDTLSGMQDAEGMYDHLCAAICTGTVRGKTSKPLTWDMYVRVKDLVAENSKRKRPREVEDMFNAARVVRREDQIAQWLVDGVVSEKSIRKDFPYLRLPKTPAAKSA